MAIRQILHLGLDFGTSKIALAWFSETSEKWEQLLISDVPAPLTHEYERYVEPSQIAFDENSSEPVFGRDAHDVLARHPGTAIVLHSIKKCLFCEWVQQPTHKAITQAECVNKANFENSQWCAHGNLQFTLDKYEWNPSALFYMLLDYAFRRARRLLDEQFERGKYLVSELKLAYPMIFSKAGRMHEERLSATVRDVAGPIFDGVLGRDFDVFVIEEPLASLMALGGDAAQTRIASGVLLVLDVGAGSADAALCEKVGPRITVLDHESEIIAGDDYDQAVARLLSSKTSGADYVFEPAPRAIKERYCISGQSVPVICLDRKSRKTADTVELLPEDFEGAFLRLNDRIATIVGEMKGRAERHRRQIRHVYLTGGGSSVPSLVDKIKQLADPASVTAITLADPDAARKYDAKIVSVSMGAAFPRARYAKVLKYWLPVNLVLRAGPIEQEAEYRLYSFASRSASPEGVLTIRNVPRQSRLKLFVEDKNGNRKILTSTHLPEGSRKAQIKYEIAFNGLTAVGLKSGERVGWKTLFNGYPHWRL